MTTSGYSGAPPPPIFGFHRTKRTYGDFADGFLERPPPLPAAPFFLPFLFDVLREVETDDAAAAAAATKGEGGGGGAEAAATASSDGVGVRRPESADAVLLTVGVASVLLLMFSLLKTCASNGRDPNNAGEASRKQSSSSEGSREIGPAPAPPAPPPSASPHPPSLSYGLELACRSIGPPSSTTNPSSLPPTLPPT